MCCLQLDEPDYNDPFDQCVALDNVIDEWIDRYIVFV